METNLAGVAENASESGGIAGGLDSEAVDGAGESQENDDGTHTVIRVR